MFWLATLLPVCFVAGYTGATMPTQWAVLSACLPLGLWRSSQTTVLHWLGGSFLIYLIFTFAWIDNWYTAILGMWYIFMWTLAFHWGSTMPTLEPMWKGLAIGLSISSTIAIAQAFGLAWPPTDIATHGMPGLLFNPTVQGMAIAVCLVGLASNGLWRWMPLLWIGCILAQSRGAWLVLALTALARFVHWSVALALLLGGSFAFIHFAGDSDIQRLQIWGQAIRGLTILGWGPDSFNDVYSIIPDAQGPELVHLEFAHNDYLQLTFEYGIGALPLFGVLACCLSRTQHPEWPALFALAIAATFFFPLYSPLIAFILCVVTGHLAADWDRVWGLSIRSRLAQLSRTPYAQRLANIIWS